ncbi:hypothetical protein MmTuc01_2923 [Methanosarcina mazei Tuc01]|uniref:Uncharacterized protein n=1 Tax=Methanosarcina mazei Tuc01 TaxID=1236903 RepID=M1Q777_METMZ|nr:hypothetical protein MmTuc01_2923 [Methanosarcina mazei Tuc01]
MRNGTVIIASAFKNFQFLGACIYSCTWSNHRLTLLIDVFLSLGERSNREKPFRIL